MYAGTGGILCKYRLKLNIVNFEDNVNPNKWVYIVFFVLHVIRGPPLKTLKKTTEKESF